MDVIVCVGMLNESLDIPTIKIAVLHSPPMSLPFTLQLIGRVSRTPLGQTGPALLFAIGETVQGEARRLYREDTNWARFVPELVEQALQAEYRDRTAALSRSDKFPYLPEDFCPFFSVRLYEYSEDEIEVWDDSDFDDLSLLKGIPRSADACNRIDGANVCPVGRREIIESEQHILIVLKTLHSLRVFIVPGIHEMPVRRESILLPRRLPHCLRNKSRR